MTVLSTLRSASLCRTPYTAALDTILVLRQFLFCEDKPFGQERQILDGWLKVRRRTRSLRGAYATRCEASYTCTSQITE